MTKVGLSHSMDVAVACLCGVNAAHVYNHIVFWLQANRTKGSNFHDGRTWMYDSIQSFSLHMPYFTYDEVRASLKKLVDSGLLLKGNYNKNKFDKTAWYSLPEESVLDDIHKNSKNRPVDITSSKRGNSHIDVGIGPHPSGDSPASTTYTNIDQREEQYNTPPPPKGEPATAGCVSSFSSSFCKDEESAAVERNERQDGKTHSSRADVLIPAQQNARDGTGNAPPSPSNTPSVTLSGRQKKEPPIAVSASFKEFGSHVKLTEQQYADLCSQSGMGDVDAIIMEMNDYLDATGKKPYKCYAAAIRQWIRRKKEAKTTSSSRGNNGSVKQTITEKLNREWIEHNGNPSDDPGILRF